MHLKGQLETPEKSLIFKIQRSEGEERRLPVNVRGGLVE
jgi:hypothetical protein